MSDWLPTLIGILLFFFLIFLLGLFGVFFKQLFQPKKRCFSIFAIAIITFLIEIVVATSVAVLMWGKQLSIEFVVQHTTQSSIMMLGTAFIYLLVNAFLCSKKKNIDLSSLLTRLFIGSFSASTIPTGLSLILCAFYNINLIQHMSGVEIYIALAGLSLIAITVLATYEEKRRIEGKPQNKLSIVDDIKNSLK